MKDNYFYEIRNISAIIQQEVSDKKVNKYQINQLVQEYGYNSKLSTDNKNKKFEFYIRETTQGSNKKVYGL